MALDIAVSAAHAEFELGCRALDRTTLELALTLSCNAQFCQMHLTKYGFASHQPTDSAGSCPPEFDTVLGNLVWADPLETRTAANEISLRPRPLLQDELESLRARWLTQLPDAVNRHCTALGTASFVSLFEQELVYLLTDQFWVAEIFPPGLPACLLQPPHRFGHTPPDAPNDDALSMVPPRKTSGLFEDHSATISHDLLSGGRFGSCYLRARNLGGVGRACVIRAVRAPAEGLSEWHTKLAEFDLPFKCVVRLVLPCKVVPVQGTVFLPLDARAFEYTLDEALNDTRLDHHAYLGLLLNVAEGLHELHSSNLVHGRLTIERSVVVSQASGSFIAKVKERKKEK